MAVMVPWLILETRPHGALLMMMLIWVWPWRWWWLWWWWWWCGWWCSFEKQDPTGLGEKSRRLHTLRALLCLALIQQRPLPWPYLMCSIVSRKGFFSVGLISDHHVNLISNHLVLKLTNWSCTGTCVHYVCDPVWLRASLQTKLWGLVSLSERPVSCDVVVISLYQLVGWDHNWGNLLLILSSFEEMLLGTECGWL